MACVAAVNVVLDYVVVAVDVKAIYEGAAAGVCSGCPSCGIKAPDILLHFLHYLYAPYIVFQAPFFVAYAPEDDAWVGAAFHDHVFK